MRRRSELGKGQFGCLVGLIILLIAGLISYKMIPIKVKAADMRDTIEKEARSAGQRNDKVILSTILQKAQQLELPITEDSVKIVRIANDIRVDVDYTVPVVFPGYTYQWHFHNTAENPIF